jgi:hypothetical protein
MTIWLGLIIAPLFALADQTVAFALVGPACARQSIALLHVSHAIFLALAIVAAVAARRRWRATTAVRAGNGERPVQLHFLAGVATAVAALSAAAIAAMWLAPWLISPCVA